MAISIVRCVADADEVVPWQENTQVMTQRVAAAGGDIKLIVKHGFRHHPHGRTDPTPVLSTGELSGRDGSTLRVNSVLLHYLPLRMMMRPTPAILTDGVEPRIHERGLLGSLQ